MIPLKISDHITFAEATKSRTATANGITWNTPTNEHLENMRRVAVECFEPLRNHFNVPISVTSFYRCERLNQLVNGSKTSSHLTGEAVDLDADVFGVITNVDIMTWLFNNVEFDQLIYEYGEWVHVSKRAKKNRRESLQCTIKNHKLIYETWRP